MKKLIFFLISFIIVSCKEGPDKFTGYIVHKEYIQGHICHSDYKQIQESSIGIVIVPRASTTPHSHKWEHSQFNVYVANRNQVKSFPVDSLKWRSLKLGSKIRFIF